MSDTVDRGAYIFRLQQGRVQLLGGLICLLTVPVFYASGLAEKEPLYFACVCLGALGGVSYGVWFWRHRVDCYANGFECRGQFLPLDGVESMQLRIETTPSKFFDVTTCKLGLRGRGAEGPLSVRCSWRILKSHCPKSDYLIQVVGNRIAQRMAEVVEQQGYVRWGRQTLLGRDNLIREDTGQQLAYRDLVEARIQQEFPTGTLVIRGSNGFVARISSAEENFFPGYAMLMRHAGNDVVVAAEAGRFHEPRRSLYFILAVGMFALALGILAVMVLQPPVDPGFGYVLIGVFCLSSIVCSWRGCRVRE